MSRTGERILRVGIPFRTREEELKGSHDKLEPYLRAIRQAGAQPVEISLGLANDELRAVAETLDGILLPGSPADVDPAHYGASRHQHCGPVDRDRERTDFALLECALGGKKPVLAICYGIQSLNVFLGGSLVQDMSSERPSTVQHQWDRESGAPEPFHRLRLESDARLASLVGAAAARVNSSHHQCIRDLGRELKIVARAEDGVIEAVESTGDTWIAGVQWHPERMAESDSVARALFRDFVQSVARTAPNRPSENFIVSRH